MAEVGKKTITAIADTHHEGYVAASLHRLGWNVVYRATSLEGLLAATKRDPDALVISSQDFRGINQLSLKRSLSLDTRINPLMSEAALRDALREVDEPLPGRARSLAATESKITLVTSIGRSVGASTFALNLAHEKTATQSSLLLLDTNDSNPYLAQQLSAHGINREIYRTSYGFSIAELISHDSLQLISPSLNPYSEIIVDYGQVHSPRKTLAGKRLHEEIFSWATQANSTLILLSRSDSRSLNQASQLINECAQSLPTVTPILLLTLNSVLSGRERGKLIKEASSQVQGKVRILSRDSRAVAMMENQNSTLQSAFPKSVLRAEIQALMEEEL